jgi:hypothetical protein
MKLFKTEQLLNGQLNRVLPIGLYKEILLIYSGTNQAGKAVTRADFGTVRVMRGNQLQHYVTVELLQRFTDLKYGTAPFSSTVGGAFSLTCKLPLRPLDDIQSGTYFDGSAGTYIELLFPDLLNLITSGIVKVYLIPAMVSTGYIPSYSMQSIQSGGASVDTEIISGRNTAALYALYNTTFTNVNVRVDGDLRVEATLEDLRTNSAINNRIENTSSDGYNLVEIDLNPNKISSLATNDRTVFGFTTNAAGSLVMMKLQYNFAPSSVTPTPTPRPQVEGVAEETA